MHCCVIYILRSNVFSRNITQKACICTGSQQFTCSTSHTCSRAVSLQTAFTTTTAHTSCTATNNHMTQFAGKTVMTINHLSVDYDTATYTCSQCDHDKILHTTGSTICHFAYSSSIRIIGQCSRNTKSLFKHSSQRNNTFPRQVWSKLNCSAIIISIRSTDTDTFYFFNSTL